MQQLNNDPRYKKIQEKYKDDKERLAQEQMKLYKELGINPMGSCLPTLIELPLILGLYQSVVRAMASTPFELFRLEQSIYPGFIDPVKVLPLRHIFLWMDLGQPERLTIFGFGVPVLAILVVISTYLQTKLISPPSSGDGQAEMMTKSMNLYMPFLMGFMAYSLASGLALYFLTSNIIGIIQYGLLGKANLSNLFPFMKKDTPQQQDQKNQKVIDAVAQEKPKAKPTPKKTTSNKRMTMPKKQSPKRK